MSEKYSPSTTERLAALQAKKAERDARLKAHEEFLMTLPGVEAQLRELKGRVDGRTAELLKIGSNEYDPEEPEDIRELARQAEAEQDANWAEVDAEVAAAERMQE